jgi:phosphoribosylformimino-5-aminoimidazole carboxamide ribotide isomerase
LDLYPAIDLLGGRCVRLVEGDFGSETVYSDDPVEVAENFAAAGARWIHVVDLDAARTGSGVNRHLVRAVAAAAAPAGVRVQSGGGVRSVEQAAALLDWGVARVVIGTAAVEDPDLVAFVATRWPGGVVVGLDHRGGVVRLKGWVESSELTVEDVVPKVMDAGASAVVVTDISRDGRMAGPDVPGLASLAAATGAPVIASGGVASTDDLRALAGVAGVVGAIVGKALYEGRLDLGEALRIAAGAS